MSQNKQISSLSHIGKEIPLSRYYDSRFKLKWEKENQSIVIKKDWVPIYMKRKLSYYTPLFAFTFRQKS